MKQLWDKGKLLIWLGLVLLALLVNPEALIKQVNPHFAKHTHAENHDNAPEIEHKHTAEMEYFYQEYFSEPWRNGESLTFLRNRIYRLGVLIILFWGYLRLTDLPQRRKKA